MAVLLDTCCGLDVHSQFVTACVLSGAATRPQKQVREFQTTTAGLLALRDWLVGLSCRAVAMESTGVYWKPVWHVLEGPDFDLLLATAQAVKARKGRKTDVGDAQWIAELHRSGYIAPSFVPPAPIRDLRDVTRYRVTLVAEQTAERNRILKLLEDANIKLGEVVSDVFGVSGWEMLQELAQTDGKPDVARVANLARGRLRNKLQELQDALSGNIREHHRYMLRAHMRHLEQLAADIADVEARIEQYLQPYREEIALLKTVPGMKGATAAVVIAEAGADMEVFADAGHFASWVGVCPGSNESADKKKPAHIHDGNRHLRSALCESGWAAAHTRNTFLSATFWRLTGRMGKKKALIAIAHKQAIAVYRILKERVPYRELGADYRRRADAARYEQKLVKRLEALGYRVSRLNDGETATATV
jgi:transposase